MYTHHAWWKDNVWPAEVEKRVQKMKPRSQKGSRLRLMAKPHLRAFGKWFHDNVDDSILADTARVYASVMVNWDRQAMQIIQAHFLDSKVPFSQRLTFLT